MKKGAQSNVLATLALAGLFMLGPFATDAYMPSFEQVAREFRIPKVEMQLTLGFYLVGYAVMSLFHGLLSDALGRRRVIIANLLVFMLGTVIAMTAIDLTMLLAARTLQGMSAGAGMIVGQAMIRDRFDGPVAQKLMSNVMLVFSVAPAIAPIIGGYISTHMSWRATFVLLLVASVLVLFLVLKALPETLPASSRQPLRLKTFLRNYKTVLGNRTFVCGALAMACFFSGLALYVSSAESFIIDILHLGETSFGWLTIPMIIGMVLGTFISGQLAGKVTSNRLLGIAFTLMAGGMLANVVYNTFFTPHIPWATLPLAIYSCGMTMALPTLSLALLAMFPTMKGLAASMISFMQMGLFSIISVVIAPLLFDSAMKLAVGGLAGVVLAMLLWFVGAQGGIPGGKGKSRK